MVKRRSSILHWSTPLTPKAISVDHNGPWCVRHSWSCLLFTDTTSRRGMAQLIRSARCLACLDSLSNALWRSLVCSNCWWTRAIHVALYNVSSVGCLRFFPCVSFCPHGRHVVTCCHMLSQQKRAAHIWGVRNAGSMPLMWRTFSNNSGMARWPAPRAAKPCHGCWTTLDARLGASNSSSFFF